jgi:MFS family permease
LSIGSLLKRYLSNVRSFSRNAKLYLVATTLQGLANGIWGVIFYLYLNLNQIGFQPNFIANMFTVGAIATGLTALPAGLLCERIGSKRALIIGFASVIFNLIQIVVLQPSLLLFASLASGLIGTASGVAGAPFMMENSRPGERTHLFSINWTISVIMGVIGSSIGGFMPDLFNMALGRPIGATIGSPEGFRISLAIAMILAMSALIPILLIREDNNAHRQKLQTLLGLHNVSNPSTILKFMVPTGIIGFGAGFIVPLFSLFFKLKFSASSSQIGAIFALGNITLGVGTLLAPQLAQRLGKVKAIVLCQYISMPFIMLMTLSPNLALATTSYLARGALMNMAGPINTAFEMEMVAETERATTSGLLIMSDNVPRAVTASISGEMMTGSDFYTPFLFTTVTYFVASSIYFAFFRKAEKGVKE